MPRHDWFDNDTMSRDRDRMSRDDRSFGRDRDSGSFFGGDRDYSSDRDQYGERDRHLPGGWGGLMGDDRDRYRSRDRDHDRERNDRERMSRRDDNRHYGSDDHNRGVPMDETDQLIASNKVEGTPVYDRNGDKLGSIHNFMVHKTKGHVVYAVLKHGGGFLGLNERYYPLEWDQLDYDTRLGGYHTRLEEEDLKSFGSFDSDGRWHRSPSSGRNRDRDYRRESSRSQGW